MFTTVHPAGQRFVPRAIVSFVPSVVGHLNVPVAATPLTQFVILVEVGNEVILVNSMYFKLVHPLNIEFIPFPPTVAAAITGDFSSDEQPLNMLLYTLVTAAFIAGSTGGGLTRELHPENID